MLREPVVVCVPNCANLRDVDTLNVKNSGSNNSRNAAVHNTLVLDLPANKIGFPAHDDEAACCVIVNLDAIDDFGVWVGKRVELVVERGKVLCESGA